MKKTLTTKSNMDQAKKALENLYALGVKDFVVCPGGRNAPFVELLEKNKSDDIAVHWGFEERSASFFALGLAMKNHQPVAVFTTSGTAFVETTSALLEAHYLGLPLIVVSADRPAYQWGSGAPQTMVQKDFLKSHLGPSADINFKIKDVSLPLHINCSFVEPLLDQKIEEWSFESKTRNINANSLSIKKSGTDRSIKDNLHKGKLDLSLKLNPYKYRFLDYSKNNLNKFLKKQKLSKDIKTLFIFSGLDVDYKKTIKTELKGLNADLYFESTGEIFGLENQINSTMISKSDVLKSYDLVIRVGGIPTHRFWRDIENEKFNKVLHFSNLPLPGLSFGKVHPLKSFIGFLRDFKSLSTSKNMTVVENSVVKSGGKSVVKSVGKSMSKSVVQTLANSSDSSTKISSDDIELTHEQMFFKSLKTLDKETVFYIGNSLPIRNWDLTKTKHFEHVYANRGLNGIDGQLSTALGLALKYQSQPQKVFAVLGDLTALYDLSAPWYWKQNKSKLNFCLVVVNNSGGQIFSKMFNNRYFLNEHNLNFKSFAKMWGLSYLQLNSHSEFESLKKFPDIVELKIKK